ncbi:MAG: peptidoglycan DD-metalloendopeptidase family protein [Bacilli bacterium]|nr:peptidoglycan DD-metalloendopeptidase family protein [Bacilli bacterium]MCI9435150.1 peptidoglycan DD-metalloendopeptidase family protein [Bacilli bacterium]
MEKDIEKIKMQMKEKRSRNYEKKDKTNVSNNILYKIGLKFLITILLTISTLIILKKFPNLKDKFYNEIYEKNISFASINHFYKNTFGSPIPFSDYFENKIKPVFNEKLTYYSSEQYQDGVKLMVANNYLVPSLESGMVVFIGDKDNYPNTIIIEQVNGINVWYSNIENINVNLYDYIDKGTLLGSTINDELYLVYKKDGKTLDYNDYI